MANPGFNAMCFFVVICASVYQIWLARNDALWNYKVDFVHKHVYRFKRTIIDKIYNILSRKCTRKHRD